MKTNQAQHWSYFPSFGATDLLVLWMLGQWFLPNGFQCLKCWTILPRVPRIINGFLIHCVIKAGCLNRLVGKCIACWLLGCWANMNTKYKDLISPESQFRIKLVAQPNHFRKVTKQKAEHSSGDRFQSTLCVFVILFMLFAVYLFYSTPCTM